LFQQPDPPTQLEITSSAHKQMDMIGHNYVSAHGNIEILLGSPGKKNESRMDLVRRKASDLVMRAKSNEIKRARIKDSTETERAAPKIFLTEILYSQLCGVSRISRPAAGRWLQRMIPES
jgi:hypothetical protein